jgi:hypothetical protein
MNPACVRIRRWMVSLRFLVARRSSSFRRYYRCREVKSWTSGDPNRSKIQADSLGGRAMAMRTAFLMRSPRILPILLWVICLLVPAEAQHGGGGGGHSGGGHFGGGHFGGGHSSGRHSAASQGHGHFGWLRFWSGRHSTRRAETRASSIFASDVSPHGPSHLGTFATLAGTRSISRTPSTLLWSPPLFHADPTATAPFPSSTVHRHRDFFFNRYSRFSSSGCFLNGLNQICFFEPFLPLLSFAGLL